MGLTTLRHKLLAPLRALRPTYSKIRTYVARGVFALIYRPDAQCSLSRIGSAYGGWWVPDHILGHKSICYTAGVGTDISFDLGLMTRFGCQVWAMDPTPRSVEWIHDQTLPSGFFFLHVGLSDSDGVVRFWEPRDSTHVSHSIKNLQRTDRFVECAVTSVRGAMRRLGHERIDLLKLDIEGAEHDAIRQMLNDGIYPSIVCVEFDQPEPLRWAWRTVRRLRRDGYQLAKVDKLNFTFTR